VPIPVASAISKPNFEFEILQREFLLITTRSVEIIRDDQHPHTGFQMKSVPEEGDVLSIGYREEVDET
jgi:hypothetical protein